MVLISNGEEFPYILTPYGKLFAAGIAAPTNPPVWSDDGAGTLTNGKYVRYAVAYSIDGVFPLVVGGTNLRSNPTLNVPNIVVAANQVGFGFAGDRKLKVTVDAPTDPNTTHVHFFRTVLHVTLEAANIAAAAGDMYYMGKVATNHIDPVVFFDNVLTNVGFELLSLFNHSTPQFRYCVWDGDYFWGFGNHPFVAPAIWLVNGNIQLDAAGPDKFYSGRNGQHVSFDGITTGGFDGRGGFLFEYVSDYLGHAVQKAGDPPALPSNGSGYVTVEGEGATLYRSNYRNPFAWGRLRNVGGIYVPELWLLKISGGLGTAIAVMPNQDLIKLDMEFPTLSVTYNRNAAATEQFEFTRQRVSTVYSVTSHFSQFSATNNGRTVLWGMDFKNNAILEFDGVNQTPISGPISTLLRTLTKDRTKHLLCHGLQDSNTELNAIWCSTNEPGSFQIDFCIYNHWPTGFWGVVRDYGVLCSAAVEDLNTSQRITMVGTETGFVGRAFDPITLGNWLPTSGIYKGTVASATATTIVRAGAENFDTGVSGVLGNYLMVVAANGLATQIREITAVTVSQLTVDRAFATIPTIGDKFFIGLIEVSMLKYFDSGEPSKDTRPIEFWIGLSDADVNNPPIIQFFPEHSPTPTKSILLRHDNSLDAWFAKQQFPTKFGKTFGLAVIDRSYAPVRFYNFTLKT